MKYITQPISSLLFIVLICSCGTESTPVYTLTTTCNPVEGGSIAPESSSFDEGEVVSLQATPEQGWLFSRWEQDLTTTANPMTITMNRDYNIVGVFEKRNYPLNITIEGEGSVDEKLIQQKTTDYPFETMVELTATPIEGWVFTGWGGDLQGNENPKTITITQQITVIAVFERNLFDVMVTVEGEGDVEIAIVSGQEQDGQYEFESVLTLTAIAADGWEFDGWSGDLESTRQVIEVTVEGETDITATFKRSDYPLTITIEGEGEVEQDIISSPKTTDYPFETVVEVTAIPADHWVFHGWSGDASGTDHSVTITIDSDKTVTAIFRVPQVINPVTGKTWMDRNLGASRAATSNNDAAAYGDLYQWGRGTDGHQNRNSGTTSTLSSSDQPGHGSFILVFSSPWDWRSPQSDNLWQGVNGINNPCPSDYRLPTEVEWEAERQTWSSNNVAGAFASPLKLPAAGLRSSSNSTVSGVGFYGRYWSSTASSTRAWGLNVGSSDAYTYMNSSYRARGRSVRCIKD